ncbi:hypothetical protein B0H16DRAFT_1901589 [Mycena metata]|uniref:Uncharacterized protein n=1 Tax=Mycena metata TaxID=1033252 RepID=A0AAD7GW98_9AGAR|nr:hypothetical protein B0H16DRAFT_1901589 [Mycena metata]
MAAPSASPAHQAAWDTATSGASTATVHGTKISSPSQSISPPSFGTSLAPTSTPPPPAPSPTSTGTPDTSNGSSPPKDFLLSGKLDSLFGLATKLAADFYSYHGELPAGVTLPADASAPIYQLATLKDDLLMSTILPKLAGTEFDHMPLKNVVFTYQNCQIDPSKLAGFYINGDIVFDSSFGAVHDALSTVLGIPNPTLHIQGSLGASSSFNEPLKLSSFTLRGSFPDLVIKPCAELTLSAIAVELLGYDGVRHTSNGTAYDGMCYGFHIVGAMHIGLDQLLDLTFDISDDGAGTLELTATQADSWKGAFGVGGLTLQGFTLHTTLDAKKVMDTFNFTVSATLTAGNTVAPLNGVYNADKTLSVSANFANLGTSGLSDLYEHIHGSPLATPKLSVQIGSATLTIASGSGFSLTIQDLSVEHYTGVNAEVDFSSIGAVAKANLTDNGSGENTLQFNEIEIDKAYIQITFGSKSVDIILGGELRWESFTLDAGVHIYRTAPLVLPPETPAEPPAAPPASSSGEASRDGTQPANSLHWTVFANFVTAANAEQGLPFSTLIPALKGTFLGDVTLENAAFIAASQDDPEFGNFNTTNFPVQQGVQVCAVLGLIKHLSDIMRVGDQPRLVLSAAWSKAYGFALDVLLPSPMQINLGRGIITDPFSLQIRTTSTSPSVVPPTIQLNAGLKIPTANNPDPLHFTFSLAFNALEVTATGELAGYWSDPFGLSPKLSIGPNVLLLLGITFEDALPVPFGFVGGLQIGEVTANVAFEVSDVPSQELLSAEVQNLHITDVVQLAEDFIQKKIPNIPDFMVFKDIKLYICPTGITMGDVVYQRGCQFYADMLIFGQEAQVNVQIDGKAITASSSLDNLMLGALHVTGTDGPKATAQVEINPDKQAGSLNGKITLYDLEIDLDLQFEFKPDPSFHFHFDLNFTTHLKFTVDANMVGKMENIHDLSSVQFHLLVVMQQDILDYVAQSVNAQFKQATQTEESDIDTQKAKVSAAKKVIDQNVKEQQATVDKAYGTWKAKSDAVNNQFKATTDAYNAQVKALQGQLDAATAKYRAGLADAQHKLSAANADRASKMQAAQVQLATAQRDLTNKMGAAQKQLDSATRDMNAKFGDAQKNIDAAQGKVNDIQHQIDDIDGKISKLEHLHGIKAVGKAGLPALYTGKGTLIASMKTAEGILDAAKGVLSSQNYLAAHGVMQAAQGTLTGAQKSGQAAISTAQATVATTDKVTQGTVDAAASSFSQVGKVGPAAIDTASKSLDAYKKAGVVTLNTAKASVDALAKSTEWLAYQSALTGLKAAQSSTHELDLANGALEVAEKGGAGVLQAADYVASHSLTFVDIHYIRIECDFDKAIKGAEFAANVQGNVAGKAFAFDITYDPRKTTEFINNTFQKLLDEVKNSLPH